MAESCHFFFYFSSDPSTVRKKYRTFCRASEKIQDIWQDFRSVFRYTCQALLYLGSILKVAMLVVSNSRPIPVYPKAHFALLCTSATYFWAYHTQLQSTETNWCKYFLMENTRCTSTVNEWTQPRTVTNKNTGKYRTQTKYRKVQDSYKNTGIYRTAGITASVKCPTLSFHA